MRNRHIPGAILALALLAGPALDAQQPVPQEASPEVQGWLQEMQALEARLIPLQEQALEDEELRQAQQALMSTVQTAMAEDPELTALTEQATDLQTRAQAAQAAEDEEAMQGLMVELQQLQRDVEAAQQSVLQQPEISRQAVEFQTRLRAKVVELDAEAEALLTRHELLRERLAAAARGSRQ